MEISFADICGYLGSALVVASFMLKDLRKIRIVNLVGCLFFVIYGVLKGGGDAAAMYWPVIIPNGFLCFIQAYHIFKAK